MNLCLRQLRVRDFPVVLASPNSIHADYPDSASIKELVYDTVIATNRGEDKAREWYDKLQKQDIETVGDLRALHEEDWASLNLTVFASRALKNAMSRKNASNVFISPKNISSLKPGETSSTISPTSMTTN